MCSILSLHFTTHIMPKRKNPFGDCTPQQLKIHVGFKELATQDELQEIYDRTQAVLFRGANPRTLGQDANVPASCNDAAKGPSKHPLPLCYYCKNACTVTSKCWFCERSVCSSCLGTCANCKQTCCTLCSIMNYDQSEVRFFCLDCVA